MTTCTCTCRRCGSWLADEGHEVREAHGLLPLPSAPRGRDWPWSRRCLLGRCGGRSQPGVAALGDVTATEEGGAGMHACMLPQPAATLANVEDACCSGGGLGVRSAGRLVVVADIFFEIE